MSNLSEVNQDSLSMLLLQLGGEIDCQCSGSGAAFRVDDRENTGLAAGASLLRALCRVTVESLQKGIGARGAIHKLARPHGGDDVHRVSHLAYRKDRDLTDKTTDEFDRVNGALGSIGIQV